MLVKVLVVSWVLTAELFAALESKLEICDSMRTQGFQQQIGFERTDKRLENELHNSALAGAAEVVQDMTRREAIDKGLSGLSMGSSRQPVYWRLCRPAAVFDAVRGVRPNYALLPVITEPKDPSP
jgi:hypothetical protein